jgi:hypothetical protein
MDKVMEWIGIIGAILSGLWFTAIIFIDLPGWIGLIPIGMMIVSVIYSDKI